VRLGGRRFEAVAFIAMAITRKAAIWQHGMTLQDDDAACIIAKIPFLTARCSLSHAIMRESNSAGTSLKLK